MRLPLVIGAIGTIAIIVILLLPMQYTEVVESNNNLMNARIEVVTSNKNPTFNDEFVVDGIRLSELNIMIVSDARSPLDALVNNKAIASIISNDRTREYLLAFDNYTKRLEVKDGLLTAEYDNEIAPDRLIIKGDKQIELAVKPLIKEVINNETIYYELRRVRIDEQEIIVEIADTNEKRALGLMYRDYIPERSGMLFILDKEGRTSFWMKNMIISLDMIWIDSEGRIVDITKNAQPCSDDISACIYTPDEPAKYVLEVNAGFADRYGIKGGLIIEFI